MASAPNSLKPTGPTMKTMLEDSRKACVSNDNRQIDQAIKGEWTTLKVLSESGLPEDIYQLDEATKASSGKDALFTEQVLFSNSKAVYQPPGRGVVEHPRSAFVELEARGEKIVDGRGYTVAYTGGKGVASNAQTADVVQPRIIPKGHGASM